ncbi:hypothetical protein EC988_000709 [Linderina pennispora]|nr:hypothetical protein EC988_000709 [Linderina pennispora]
MAPSSVWEKLRPHAEKRLAGIKWVAKPTKRAGHARELAYASIFSDHCTVVVAIGGDGLLHEVVNGYMDAHGKQSGAAIAVIPAGTGNDFVRSFPKPPAVPAPGDILDLILNDQRVTIDIGKYSCTSSASVRSSTGTSGYFVNATSVGLGGHTAMMLAQARWKKYVPGSIAYLAQAVKTYFVDYRAPLVRYSFCLKDGGGASPDITAKLLIGVVANGRVFAGNIGIDPAARLDDGLLSFVCIKNTSLAQVLAKIVPAALLSTLSSVPPALGDVAKNAVSIHMEAVDEDTVVIIETDGEIAGVLPADFEVVPRCLDIIALEL